ncbi:helix-turn-helix domain-containing protein [Microbacteriaceae bacterium VKM Ac-2855]|nr:helix-turn-helix domain-containing protein [Microbacteriaceae bacterium VKM Ac-2855]
MTAPSSPADLIRRAREDIGYSQRDLAAAAGMKQPNLAAIESGTREASPELVSRILSAARLRPSIPLELYAESIRDLAASYGLHDVRVFGSTIRGTDTERSDVDLLVGADDDVDFLRLAAFRGAAEDILGFPVDAVIDDPRSDVVRLIREQAVPL